MSGWLSPEKLADVTRVLDLAGVFANGLLGGGAPGIGSWTSSASTRPSRSWSAW